MSEPEIERALTDLRLPGMAATLEIRILQAQATGETFLETFCVLVQDELDRPGSPVVYHQPRWRPMKSTIFALEIAILQWREMRVY